MHFQADYDQLTRISYYLAKTGNLPLTLLEEIDLAQQIIRLRSRLAGCEVR